MRRLIVLVLPILLVDPLPICCVDFTARLVFVLKNLWKLRNLTVIFGSDEIMEIDFILIVLFVLLANVIIFIFIPTHEDINRCVVPDEEENDFDCIIWNLL